MQSEPIAGASGRYPQIDSCENVENNSKKVSSSLLWFFLISIAIFMVAINYNSVRKVSEPYFLKITGTITILYYCPSGYPLGHAWFLPKLPFPRFLCTAKKLHVIEKRSQSGPKCIEKMFCCARLRSIARKLFSENVQRNHIANAQAYYDGHRAYYYWYC